MDIYNSNWNETDASNTTAAPDGAPEGMNPSGVDDVIRAMMGAIKRFVDQYIPATTAGTSTAYTLSYTVAPGALVDGMAHLVKFNATNGTAPTLNVNSLGAKPIHKQAPDGTWGALASGDLLSGSIHRVNYDSTTGAYRITSSASPIGMAFLNAINTFASACTFSSGVTFSSAITYGGVTLTNAVTGTGKMVLDTAPTLSNPVVGTRTQGDNSTKAASTAYVDRAALQQVQFTMPGALVTGVTNTWTFNDSVPQNTWGDQWTTLAITPKSATSRLVIDVMVFGSATGGAGLYGIALFQDTTANALSSAVGKIPTTNDPTFASLSYEMTSGTTSATTFKVRFGTNTGGTAYVNGVNGARYFGGTAGSYIRIMEIGI